MSFLRHFLLALQFFTRVPVTGRLADWVGFSPAMLRASAAHFPGVGWVVGLPTAAVFAGVWWWLPAQPAAPWVAAVASTAFSVLLTGVPATPSAPTSADRSRNCHTLWLKPMRIVGTAKPKKPSTK